jgi:hypothetical protein
LVSTNERVREVYVEHELRHGVWRPFGACGALMAHLGTFSHGEDLEKITSWIMDETRVSV